ncbi:MAG: hypothetical protein M3176_07630 [Chloroflexota bacterium]|nr:hypothetical protein [Chloroflexota bacterium]MDQ6906680.1 hypothetical protein [Chloroflexota bacterium]
MGTLIEGERPARPNHTAERQKERDQQRNQPALYDGFPPRTRSDPGIADTPFMFSRRENAPRLPAPVVPKRLVTVAPR